MIGVADHHFRYRPYIPRLELHWPLMVIMLLEGWLPIEDQLELKERTWIGSRDHEHQSLFCSAEGNIEKTPGVLVVRKGGGVTRHHHDVAAFEALGLMDSADSGVGRLGPSVSTAVCYLG